jgi:hypothetical protein
MTSNLETIISELKSNGYSVNNWYLKNKENEEIKKMYQENALKYYHENKDKVKERLNRPWTCECGHECKLSLKQYHQKKCSLNSETKPISEPKTYPKKIIQCKICNKSLLSTSIYNHQKKCSENSPMVCKKIE